MVIFDPLGRWSIIRMIHRDWLQEVGGRPAPGSDCLPVCYRGFWSLLDGRKLCGTLISLCKPDMFLLLPRSHAIHQKQQSMESLENRAQRFSPHPQRDGDRSCRSYHKRYHLQQVGINPEYENVLSYIYPSSKT